MLERIGTTARFALLVLCSAQVAIAQPVPDSPDAPAGDVFLLGLPKLDGPVDVHASFHLLSISEIEDESERVSFSGVLTLEWLDPRQAFEPTEAGVDEKIFSGAFQFNELAPGWYPQVTLANASGQYDSKAVILRVKPDGTSILSEKIEATAEVDIDMRWLPFDRQRLDLVFRVFGFDKSEVSFHDEQHLTSADESVTDLPQWTLERVESSTGTMKAMDAVGMHVASTLVVTMNVKRQPLFLLRLVVFPLTLIVILSWSVFWMDRSSVGDRMSVSFVGILAAVAYQITLVGIVPNVSYFTLMNEFLNLSFVLMCATVVINLVVAAADRKGHARGDRIDRHCRWIFPLAFVGLNATAVAIAFLFF